MTHFLAFILPAHGEYEQSRVKKGWCIKLYMKETRRIFPVRFSTLFSIFFCSVLWQQLGELGPPAYYVDTANSEY